MRDHRSQRMPDVLTSYDGRGLHGNLVEHIGRLIVSGTLSEGETLDLNALESRFDASRTGLREALRVLATKGLLKARQRRGTYVLPVGEWSRLDPDVLRWRLGTADLPAVNAELDEVRSIVEPAAAALAAQRATTASIALLEAALDALASAGDDAGEVTRADLAFHRALLDATGNSLLSAMEVVLKAGLEARDHMVHESHHDFEKPAESHRPVVDAIRAGDPAAAHAAMAGLLEIARSDAARALDARQGRSDADPGSTIR